MNNTFHQSVCYHYSQCQSMHMQKMSICQHVCYDTYAAEMLCSLTIEIFDVLPSWQHVSTFQPWHVLMHIINSLINQQRCVVTTCIYVCVIKLITFNLNCQSTKVITCHPRLLIAYSEHWNTCITTLYGSLIAEEVLRWQCKLNRNARMNISPMLVYMQVFLFWLRKRNAGLLSVDIANTICLLANKINSDDISRQFATNGWFLQTLMATLHGGWEMQWLHAVIAV